MDEAIYLRFETEALRLAIQRENISTYRSVEFSVSERQFTGIGYYVKNLSSAAYFADEQIVFGDSISILLNDQFQCGLVCYVRLHALDELEFFLYDGLWPDKLSTFQIS